ARPPHRLLEVGQGSGIPLTPANSELQRPGLRPAADRPAMPSLRVLQIVALAAIAAACATTSEPAGSARSRTAPSPNPRTPPSPDTQKAVFDLIQVSLICLQYN